MSEENSALKQRLPWHDGALRQIITTLLGSDDLPVICLQAPSGYGADISAQHLAATLLCQLEDFAACGECDACTLKAAGTHPDYYSLCAQSDETIKVDQVRAALPKLYQQSYLGGFKILLISPADRLNRAAANCLLKTLEEPPSHTLIILVLERSQRIPATLLSRVRKYHLPMPSTAELHSWLCQFSQDERQIDTALMLTDQVPMAALSLLNDLTQQARYQAMHEFLTAANARVGDIGAVKACLDEPLTDTVDKLGRALAQQLKTILQAGGRAAQSPEVIHYFAYYDKLLSIQKKLAQATGLNQQLLLETLLLEWPGQGNEVNTYGRF